MKFIADLHIHSRFSRATSRDLYLESLYIAAQQKGIQVLGTGDATHPGWFEEICSRLVPAEPGLYRLDDGVARVCDLAVPPACRGPVRFILSSEISNIYKKEGKTRKNHNLVFMPDIPAAQRFNARLEKIGNIRSDGRPILGLDARDLLDLVLTIDPQAFLVPAHIWTPWFSMLGSRSGFDSLEECFGDLSGHVFAAETGLSSDPEMNWRVSGLDRLTLISNSDAHSAAKLGREANCFDTQLSFAAIRRALEDPGSGAFAGTIEFYPQEGKYHLDGHRKCAVRLTPAETREREGICPVCHRPLTLGVLHRVECLADRAAPQPPATAPPFRRLVPLADLLSEVLQCGSGSKRVASVHRRCLENLGNEFAVLLDLPLEKISRLDIPLLDEAVRRMRQGSLFIDGGYDGEFGTIRIFTAEERRRMLGQKSLFSLPRGEAAPGAVDAGQPAQKPLFRTAGGPPAIPPAASSLNALQQTAVELTQGPMMVVAGPGTGKTLTLTRRIARLIETGIAAADQILAVTFTQKAADEMQRRLAARLPKKFVLPPIGTFHGLCYRFIKEIDAARPLTILDEERRLAVIRDAMALSAQEDIAPSFSARQMLQWIEAVKQRLSEPQEQGPADAAQHRCYLRIFQTYCRLMDLQGLVDFDDLIAEMVQRLEGDESLLQAFRRRFPHILVDEYQDINLAQYRLVRAMAGPHTALFVIGDPDQCIYGFRGSDWRYFDRFLDDYPGARLIRLHQSYRSPQSILDAAGQVVSRCQDGRERVALTATAPGRLITVLRADSERAEAVAIGRVIEQMVGGSGFEAGNFGKLENEYGHRDRSFAEFAVLYRTHEQGRLIADVLEDYGIPCRIASRRGVCDAPHVIALISWLRLLIGQGGFFDLEQALPWIDAAMTKIVLSRFKQWCYGQGWRFDEGTAKAARFPVKGMKAAQQHRLVAALAQIETFRAATRDRGLPAMVKHVVENTGISKVLGESPPEAGMAVLNQWIDVSRNETDLLLHLSHRSDADAYDERAERVALMTLHAAKGLEFNVVFIAGCEDGLIPLQRAADPDEERRLFYVGLTRAKERLFLCVAARRTLQGLRQTRSFSPFAAEIEARLVETQQAERNDPPRRRQIQMNLF